VECGQNHAAILRTFGTAQKGVERGKPTALFHAAARLQTGESIRRPGRKNVVGHVRCDRGHYGESNGCPEDGGTGEKTDDVALGNGFVSASGIKLVTRVSCRVEPKVDIL